MFSPPRLPRSVVVVLPSGLVVTACPVRGSMTCLEPSGKVVVRLPSRSSEVTEPSGLVILLRRRGYG
ncbi:hypothetical protein DDE05_15540 [Streptomyces cavourensis]|nr:hypothetical protein DDE05_15540 [Streptomyces cavourensis]